MNEKFVNPLAQKKQNLIWKDSDMTATDEYDVFISHASEDKEDFVRPLAEQIRKRGYRVWYDEFTMEWGDSINLSINKGISQSKFVIIVLSRNFFNKKWTESELNGFVSKEAPDRKVILPIWHKVSKKEVSENYPILADKLAIDSSQGIDYVVSEFVNIMKQKSVTLPTPAVKQPTNTTETPPRKAPSNARSEFYKKRIAAKQEELAAINSQLDGTLSAVDELKLNKQAEGIMKEIEELEAKLDQL